MKRSTLFTFLYLALGVCLTAIAFGYPNLPSGLQTSLLISAGVSYIACIFNPFWRERTIRFYRRRRNSSVILSSLVIGLTIIGIIWEVLSQNWAMEAFLGAFSQLIIVLGFAENIVIIRQVNSEN
ncbi:MAG: hypothetical protein HC840_15505 [Leptolyngbyaceae cyanobacterium RM2_2_4]|nr:hypothetical protein [Leptolyngbyaceae cyanobacterium RM2_2_4]